MTARCVHAGAAGNVTKGGKAMCEELWGDAFLYAEAGTAGYVMNFTGPNPNDAVHADVALPEPCPDHAVTDAQLQAACPAAVRYISPRRSYDCRRPLHCGFVDAKSKADRLLEVGRVLFTSSGPRVCVCVCVCLCVCSSEWLRW